MSADSRKPARVRFHSALCAGALAALLASSGPALAFRRAEHKELGDVGFVLALEDLRSRQADASPPQSDLERLFPNAGGGESFQSYGDIVSLSDFVKDPSEFLAVSECAGAGDATFPSVNFEGLARLKRSFGRYAAANALHDVYIAGGHDFEIDRAAFDADLAGLLGEMRAAEVSEWFRVPRPTSADFEGLLFPGPPIRFFGDGSLTAHQDERIFLALLTARSVLDVVESSMANEVRNSFAVREWQDFDVVREAGRQRVMTPAMKLAYGGFPSVPLDRHSGSPFSKGGHLAVLPVWAVSVGLDSIATNGEFMSAGRLDLESVWLWHLPIPPEIRTRSPRPDGSFALSTGVTLRRGADGWQAGGILRVIRPLRLIDAQVSLGVTPRWMKNSFLQDSAFRTGVEARFEWGFGLAFVGAGISRDYRLARNDPGPAQGWGVTTNVSLMLTPGIFKHLGKPFGLGL